jgi:hypothetical protein
VRADICYGPFATREWVTGDWCPLKIKAQRIGTVPETLSTCLTEADLDFYANEFKRTGFRGGLNWYRNIDRLGTDAISQRSQDSPTFALHSRRARQRNHDLSARFRQLRGNYAGLEKEGFVAGWVTTTVRYLRGGGLKSAGCGELHVRGGVSFRSRRY